MLKKVIQSAAEKFGYRISKIHTEAGPHEATRRSLRELVRPYTMTSDERIDAMIDSVTYVVKNRIPGDIVECGVWRGGNLMLAVRLLDQLEPGSRRLIWAYDTFAGMTEPSELDDMPGENVREQWEQNQKASGENSWSFASIEEVRSNLAMAGGSPGRFRLVKGPVEETLKAAENLPSQIALLRLDTDWYASTKAELEILYPRTVDGGVCIIDDYGHYEGARKAVDEYFGHLGTFPLLHRIDYTARSFVKVPRGN